MAHPILFEGALAGVSQRGGRPFFPPIFSTCAAGRTRQWAVWKKREHAALRRALYSAITSEGAEKTCACVMGRVSWRGPHDPVYLFHFGGDPGELGVDVEPTLRGRGGMGGFFF